MQTRSFCDFALAKFFSLSLMLGFTAALLISCGSGGGNSTPASNADNTSVNDNSSTDSNTSTDDTTVSVSYTGQWEDTGGPIGGLGYDVRIHPTNKSIMMVTDNYAGIGRTTDGGATWVKSNKGIDIKIGPTKDSIPIFCLTIDPNNPDIVWSGTDASTYSEKTYFGIYKSTDGGVSWTKKINGIESNGTYLTFRGFTVQEGNSDVVYCQAEVGVAADGKEFPKTKGAIFKTIDGGENWQTIWQGDALARYLIIDPEDPKTLYASTGIFDREAYNSDCINGQAGGLGVLKSTDGGLTWAQINNGLMDLYVGCLRMHPTNHNILFAATGNVACSQSSTNGLFKTTDGGTHWRKVIADDLMVTVRVSAADPNIVYAGSYESFFRSSDGGESWNSYSRDHAEGWGPPGVYGGFPIDMTIDPDNPDILYVNAYGGGVMRSTDGAQTWELWSRGFTGAILYDVHVPSYTSSTVYAAGRSGPFKSTQYGNQWQGLANYTETTLNEWYAITTAPNNPNVIFVSLETQGEIYRSADGGQTYTQVLDSSNETSNGFLAFAFAPSNPSTIYAGVAMGNLYPFDYIHFDPSGPVIYRSDDGGLNFSKMSSEIDGRSINRLIVSPQDANTVYAATRYGLYKTTDGALSWSRFEGLGDRAIGALAIDFDRNYIIAGELYGGIWLSDDDGATWSGPNSTGFNSANPYINALVMDSENPQIVFASDLYSGVYHSTDQGLTWAPFPDESMSGLAVRAVKDIALTEKVIYVCTQGGGVFRFVRK